MKILFVTPFPPSPPQFGAQARIHGLASELARNHDVSVVSLIDSSFDPGEARAAIGRYAREIVFVPNARASSNAAKRFLQLRSLASRDSYERRLHTLPGLQNALDHILRASPFDVVSLVFPHLAWLCARQAPHGARAPVVILDAHEIAHDLARQLARGGGAARRVYGELNWPKVRREEHDAFRSVDGTYVCSAEDQARLLADVPTARATVVPNGADVAYYRPRADDPAADDHTVVFFGLLSTAPNADAARFLVTDIWPRIAAARPGARCKIIGARPEAVRHLARPGVEIIGPVDDLRPHLASAAVVAVPLRLGGGTRLKIIEAMAMAKPVVSTSLGAEGIASNTDREIVLADGAEAFAAAVVRLLSDRGERTRLGIAARARAVERYTWSSSAARLEGFIEELRRVRPDRSRSAAYAPVAP